MKNLLILVDSIGPRKKLFAEGVKKRFSSEDKVFLSEFSDITIRIDGINFTIFVGTAKTKITDFDVVYFRRVGTKFFSLAGTLAICLKYLGVKYFDTTFSQVGPDEDKFTNLTRLSLAGLPMIPTFFSWHSRIMDNRDDIIAELGLPLVAKDLASHRGKGVILIQNRDDFKKLPSDFPKDNFMFQKYIESKEEYRILVLKDGVGAFEKKIPQKGEWRSNVALGAKEEFIDVNRIPKSFKDIAIRAAASLNIQIAGVDILLDKNGKTWLLEVNRGPGITYDDLASPEITNLAKFFAEELKRK